MTARTAGVAKDGNADGVVMGRIWIAGLVAIVGSVVANLLTVPLMWALAPGVPADFPPFQMGSIAIFTALQVGLGVGVFALIARFTRRPIRIFTIVALAALALSLIPNLTLAANPAAAPFPGGTSAAFLALIIPHFVAAAVTIFALVRLSRSA
jgi:hypothetical protein